MRQLVKRWALQYLMLKEQPIRAFCSALILSWLRFLSLTSPCVYKLPGIEIWDHGISETCGPYLYIPTEILSFCGCVRSFWTLLYCGEVVTESCVEKSGVLYFYGTSNFWFELSPIW
jgi:hypothetical protein